MRTKKRSFLRNAALAALTFSALMGLAGVHAQTVPDSATPQTAMPAVSEMGKPVQTLVEEHVGAATAANVLATQPDKAEEKKAEEKSATSDGRANINTNVNAEKETAESKQVKTAGQAAQSGVASWYGGMFHGRLTANGERFNKNLMTAAHRFLPFGTVLRVVHRATGRSVVVRVNDRGPFVKGRIIDLSQGAARALGFSGTALVDLFRVDRKNAEIK